MAQRLVGSLTAPQGKLIFFASVAALLFAAIWDTPLSSYLIANCLFFGVVLGAAVISPKSLSQRWVSYIGALSFSIYIWHFAVLGVITLILPTSYRSGNFGLLILFTLTAVFSILTSSLSYHLIEKPFVRLGRKITRRPPPAALDGATTAPIDRPS